MPAPVDPRFSVRGEIGHVQVHDHVDQVEYEALIRHMRDSLDAGLRESGAFTFGDPEDETICVDGDIFTQDLAEFIVEKMIALGWSLTKRKREDVQS